jgi:hypothetical protein
LAKSCQPFWIWQFAFSVGNLKTSSNTKIMHWEYVAPTQVKDEKHFDCPPTNSFDLGEPLHSLPVSHPVAFLKRGQQSICRALSDIENVDSLCSGQYCTGESIGGYP